MKLLILLPFLVAAAVQAAENDDTYIVSEDFIKTINSLATTWKVSEHSFEDWRKWKTVSLHILCLFVLGWRQFPSGDNCCKFA